MDRDRNELIRARAHEIWEKEGRPTGHAEEHWRQAEAELSQIGAQDAQPAQNDALPELGDEPAALTAPRTRQRKK